MTNYKKVKIIFARPKPVGMFSLFHQVIEHIYLAEKEDSVPLVYFNDICLFWSPAGCNGARNVWEYYFEPVSDAIITDYVFAPLEQLEHADIQEFEYNIPNPVLPIRVSSDKFGKIKMAEGAYATNLYTGRVIHWIFDLNRGQRKKLNKIVLERIKIKEPVPAKVEAYAKKHFNKRPVFGVHIRGGEHSDERGFFVKGGFLPIDYYKKEIDRFLNRHPEAGMYAASDVQDNITELKKTYGSKVMSYGAVRLDAKDESVGLHTHPGYDKVTLGQEVLIEALLLSKCDFLIHGPSNVSAAAMLFNPELRHVNVYQKYGYWFSKQRYQIHTATYKAKLWFIKNFPKLYKKVKREKNLPPQATSAM